MKFASVNSKSRSDPSFLRSSLSAKSKLRSERARGTDSERIMSGKNNNREYKPHPKKTIIFGQQSLLVILVFFQKCDLYEDYLIQ